MFVIRFLCFFLFFYSLCAVSKPIELSTVPSELLINEHLYILKDPSATLSLKKAFKEYKHGRFTKNLDERVSFGFTSDVIWASVLIKNGSTKKIKKILYLDNSWLDHADFYFIRESKVVKKSFLGDVLPFSSREKKTRMLSQQYTFKPGTTQVLMRFESKDPLLIPLYLSTEQTVQNNLVISNYFYGFIYGAFFILLIYNVAIYISLKDISYVLYFLYLLSFLSLNITYTGHGFKYIWPESIFIQQWLLPFFIYCYLIFGIAFCFEFLKLNVFLPKLYRLKIWIYAGLILLTSSLLINADQMLAVRVGVGLVSLLGIIFILLGFLALNNGHNMVKFFIPSVFMGGGGAAISSATTWGVIPYYSLLFHSMEVGMLLEMSILALAFAFNLKEVNKARIIAEVNAQMDHLTELYNRRAFIEAVSPHWYLGIREQKNVSLILLDIDWFKKINDEYGHAAGDAVLKGIAYTLKRKVRKSDVLARWGGEEFIILLPNTKRSSAIKLANILRKKIEKMIVLHEGLALSITASFGVADFHGQMKELDDLIKLADVALYKAKNSGRNIVCEVQETDETEDVFTENLAEDTKALKDEQVSVQEKNNVKSIR